MQHLDPRATQAQSLPQVQRTGPQGRFDRAPSKIQSHEIFRLESYLAADNFAQPNLPGYWLSA
jgi:hypothetical protein